MFFFILKTRYVHFLLLGFNISLRKSFSLKIIKTNLYIFLIYILYVFASLYNRGVPGGPSGKEPACKCRTCRRLGFNPWSGRSLGWASKGNPLQNSCLEHPMDRRIQGVTESRTQLSDLTHHAFANGIPTLVYIYLCSPCSLTYIFVDGPQSSPVAAAGTETRSSLGP